MFEILKALLALAMLAALSGCGAGAHGLATVTGQVLLDGKPLTSGSVNTVPDQGRGARGEIDGQGRFTLDSGDLGAGAVVGTHRVAVVAVERQENPTPESLMRLLVPKRYTNPETSGLVIEVEPGKVNQVTLELSSK